MKAGPGSALLLTVVLTSLLGIIGIVFVLSTRLEKLSTSAILENKELEQAVDSILSKLSEQLVLDVPGVSGQEYYDYPDSNNAWLAAIEPYLDAADGDYKWSQISDITGYLRNNLISVRNVEVDPPGTRKVIRDYPTLYLNASNKLETAGDQGQLADADGDGIADSKWFEFEDMATGNGKPIYAAVRVIDNGGMINVNTAYKFNPGNTDARRINGTYPMQVNLAGLIENGATEDINDLHDLRHDSGDLDNFSDYDDFYEEMVQRMDSPDINHCTPYDISDELELRYRFCLNNPYIWTRIEQAWPDTIGLYEPNVPYDGTTSVSPDRRLDDWQLRVTDPYDNMADKRHMMTTHNFDRIIDPAGDKKFHLRSLRTTTDPNNARDIYNKLMRAYSKNNNGMAVFAPAQQKEIAKKMAQLAVNLVDFYDTSVGGEKVTWLDPRADLDTTWFDPNQDLNIFNFTSTIDDTVYGFEVQPFITEFAIKVDVVGRKAFYAVELYNPFNVDIDMNDFSLFYGTAASNPPLKGAPTTNSVTFSGKTIPAGTCMVITNDQSQFTINTTNIVNTPGLRFFGSWTPAYPRGPGTPGGGRGGGNILLTPNQAGVLAIKKKTNNNRWICVDYQLLNPTQAEWNQTTSNPNNSIFYERGSVNSWHIVYGDVELTGLPDGGLGSVNTTSANLHPFSFLMPNHGESLVTVGDLSRILTIGPAEEPAEAMGNVLAATNPIDEKLIRLDYQNPFHRNIFQHFALADPSGDLIDNDRDGLIDETAVTATPEYKIPGRVNINTAPYYVIAQLPWISKRAGVTDSNLAKAIVAYRDKTDGVVDYSGVQGRYLEINSELDAEYRQASFIREEKGFASIGELNFVIGGQDANSIAYYSTEQAGELSGFPDLTVDGIADDFEERDMIFTRISDLTTVRSDVFTAYILVRIGHDGPQKRVIAILDRSDVYNSGDKVKIVAYQQVPDPR